MSIITITLQNKTQRQYDLTNSLNITAFKRLVTNAINKQDINRLTEIKNQLEKISTNSVLKNETLAKIAPLFQLAEPTPATLIEFSPISLNHGETRVIKNYTLI